MTKNNSGLKAAILTMSFIQMATNAVSSILQILRQSFQMHRLQRYNI